MERRGDGAVMRVLSTIGLMILGAGLLGAVNYASWPYVPVNHIHYDPPDDFVFLGVKGIFSVMFFLCLGVYAAFMLLSRTTYAAQISASEESPELAMAQGIDPWRVKTLSWVLSGGLACLAGSLHLFFMGFDFSPFQGYLNIPILAVGVLGGFESLLFAVAAAYFVGLTQILGVLWYYYNVDKSTAYVLEYLIPFAILYFGLLLFPRGFVQLKELLLRALGRFRKT